MRAEFRLQRRRRLSSVCRRPALDGNLGRNTYEGPGFANLDFSLFKNFKIPQINEQSMLQLRFEFFNMLNRVNFYQPTPQINSTSFGRATDTFAARQIQFGLKFIF